MLCSILLTITAIIQVVTLSAVNALDPGRYTIGRGDVFLTTGTNSGDVMPKKFDEGQVKPVWTVDRVTESTGAGAAEILYTLKFEAAARFMSYNDPAADQEIIEAKSTARSFHLELIISDKNAHRIQPAKGSKYAICGGSSMFARFGVVNNNEVKLKDNH
ncbi:hypothetical protein BGZ96_000788 [Linnemannia gamsii]|uniref:Uncharacterized protein n=1 Tax=Linnemannia gamsii TaxID=64522 RepID=A0ABQ7JNL4_9FUNG|nr:hypothetical protein BGZ96_000788 [Linnemannia gamsii]